MTAAPALPLQVLPLGRGDAFSKLDYYCSLLIFGGRTLCLIDCPDPIHKILQERSRAAPDGPVRPQDIHHIILTHLHGDHCNGLESLLFHRRFVTRAQPPTIHALPEVAEALWPEKLAVSMRRSYIPELEIDQTAAPDDYFKSKPVEQGKPFRIGDLRFQIRRTRHSVPAFGFRVTCGGRSFGYSCDTTFDRALVKFLAPADLIFHDCNESAIHTSYADLLTLSPEIRRKTHILHFADDFDTESSEFPVVEPGCLYTV